MHRNHPAVRLQNPVADAINAAESDGGEIELTVAFGGYILRDQCGRSQPVTRDDVAAALSPKAADTIASHAPHWTGFDPAAEDRQRDFDGEAEERAERVLRGPATPYVVVRVARQHLRPARDRVDPPPDAGLTAGDVAFCNTGTPGTEPGVTFEGSLASARINSDPLRRRTCHRIPRLSRT